MKTFRTLSMALTLAATLAFVAVNAGAMDHGSMGSDHGSTGADHGSMGMNHGTMNMDQGSMSMHGDMIMLGDQVQDGVKAMAHLKDVKEAMGKMGMTGTTHHFMVMFEDQATGKAIDSGSVAVKIQGPEGKEEKPVKLMGMQGHFGADVDLETKGTYHFTVGTKLEDGTKRQFEFDYTLK